MNAPPPAEQRDRGRDAEDRSDSRLVECNAEYNTGEKQFDDSPQPSLIGLGSPGMPTTGEPMKTTPTPLMVPVSVVGVPMKRMFSKPAATARLDESVGRLIYWLRARFISQKFHATFDPSRCK